MKDVSVNKNSNLDLFTTDRRIMFTRRVKKPLREAFAQVSLPPEMSMRKEKLNGLKAELMARRDSLAVGLRKSTEEWIDSEDLIQADSVDQAAADTDRGIAVQMRNRDRTILREINEALRRIESGFFGDCERCDEEISEQRLKANPSTTLCINCKAELESEGQRFTGRV